MDAFIWVGCFTFILAWVFIAIQFEVIKKVRAEIDMELSRLKLNNNAAQHDLQLVQFRLNEAGALKKDLKGEITTLKKHSQFVQKAIQEKIRKKKIKAKKRKSS